MIAAKAKLSEYIIIITSSLNIVRNLFVEYFLDATVIKEEPAEDPMLNEYQPKVSSFAIPAAPSQAAPLPSLSNDLLKRAKEENETYNSSIHEETLMFNELLLKRVHQKPVKRASSDPGTMSHNTQR